MRALLVALLMMLVPGTAYAGCSHYGQGVLADVPPPRAKICYEGKCEIALLAVECSNIHGAFSGYSNGLTFAIGETMRTAGLDGNDQVRIYRNDKEEAFDFAKYSCEEIDEYSCPFFGGGMRVKPAVDATGLGIPMPSAAPR